MSIVFEVTDPRGRNVVCTEDSWNEHILSNRPWMRGWEDLVKDTIQNPYMGIFEDSDFNNRHIYYSRQQGRERYLKVVVQFDENETGSVITAYTTDSPKRGEKLIWPKSSD